MGEQRLAPRLSVVDPHPHHCAAAARLTVRCAARTRRVKPRTGQGIKAHYSGYLLKGAKFDSSYERRKPLGFDVGTGKVIKGWDEALLDMKLGEQRMLKIPSNLAYGSKGAPNYVVSSE